MATRHIPEVSEWLPHTHSFRCGRTRATLRSMQLRQLRVYAVQSVRTVRGTYILLPSMCVSGGRVLTPSVYQRYEVFTDPYHNIPRLNLYKFDGSPLLPMYLVFRPPEMLPTSTLHPASATSTAKAGGKLKRAIFGEGNTTPVSDRMLKRRKEVLDPTRWWWFGVALTGFGGFLYLCF